MIMQSAFMEIACFENSGMIMILDLCILSLFIEEAALKKVKHALTPVLAAAV